MKKKLLTQMWNERRANLPLILELFLISVALWVVTDMLYTRLAIYYQPLGFDISHTYLIQVGEFPRTSPACNSSIPRNDEDSMERLFDRIRTRSDVEAASLSIYSYPYNGRNSNKILRCDSVSVNRYHRVVSPDFFRVFRYQGMHGETPEQLSELFGDPNVIMLSNDIFYCCPKISNDELLGKKIQIHGDTTRLYPVAAVLQTVRYDEYTNAGYSLFFATPLKGFPSSSELCIRVKPEADNDFIARFWKDAPRYRSGNLFIRNIQSFADIRQKFQCETEAQQKMYYAVMFFLLLNVCMALLGVFWYRTRQRRQEIALQMAVGSSRRQVFMRLMLEGLCLLCVATLLALCVDYWLVEAGLTSWFYKAGYTPLRFFYTVALTFLLIAFTIVLSVWMPARRAMKIPPAEALHEE